MRAGERRRVNGAMRLLDKALAGRELSADEVAQLLDFPARDLPVLYEAAAWLREVGHGRVITFSPKVFIPLTRLCRDRCGYCAFRVEPGEAGAPEPYMALEEALQVARAGARLGCTEALFTLGERPEQRYPEALGWLRRRGFRSTPDYLYHVAGRVLEQTGLLPHVNAGILSSSEMGRLREVSASMGLMLESSSPNLYQPGGPHHLAPSKRPAARLRTMDRAGRLRIPFTTGILVGIGETREERARDLLAIRELHRRHGHIQEVIVQNFQPKPGTPMAASRPPSLEEVMRTVSVARIVLGPSANLQVPPNLNPRCYPLLLSAGINDWGGVSPLTPDYVNPEAPWPALLELKRATEAEGFELRPRLCVYAEFLRGEGRKRWLADSVRPYVDRLADHGGYVRWGMQAYVGRGDEPVEAGESCALAGG